MQSPTILLMEDLHANAEKSWGSVTGVHPQVKISLLSRCSSQGLSTPCLHNKGKSVRNTRTRPLGRNSHPVNHWYISFLDFSNIFWVLGGIFGLVIVVAVVVKDRKKTRLITSIQSWNTLTRLLHTKMFNLGNKSVPVVLQESQSLEVQELCQELRTQRNSKYS